MSVISKQQRSLVWFRNDLRLHDNPALTAAAESGGDILCVYILEDGYGAPRQPGGARKWWLNKSLKALQKSLEAQGGGLLLTRCDRKATKTILSELIEEFEINSVYWNRRYGPEDQETDKDIKSELKESGIEVSSFNGLLLREPWEVQTGSGHPYKVFTPFWKALKPEYSRTHPKGAPKANFMKAEKEKLSDWSLHPENPDWSGGLEETWEPGEAGARKRLKHFIENGLADYSDTRNRPDIAGTSMLSPHLSFGEISPQQVWESVRAAIDEDSSKETGGWSYLREVAWRDFSYHLLYQAEDLADKNWNSKFDGFPWAQNADFLERWQKGQTGYPIVDAGMRELWHTGWMHNRVRMIVASFLVKHLLIHWHEGEAWFWDTLVDADPANNPASWQWVAGSGADAAPYFRIFNPITQGEKFDPKGEYIRKWVPELKNVSDKYLNHPWDAPEREITLGKDYPKPIVDHSKARQAALDAYEQIK